MVEDAENGSRQLENDTTGQVSADMNALRRLSFFSKSNPEGEGLIPDEELWTFVNEIRDVTVSRPHDLVYYPGAANDFAFPLALTDGSRFVFVDPSYDESLTAVTFMEEKLREMGIASEVISDKAGTTISFTFDGKARTMRLYANDASTFTPPELKDQPADVLLLKNTYTSYQEKAFTTLLRRVGIGPRKPSPRQLRTTQGINKLLSHVSPKGTVISYQWADSIPTYDEVYSAQKTGALPHQPKIKVFQNSLPT